MNVTGETFGVSAIQLGGLNLTTGKLPDSGVLAVSGNVSGLDGAAFTVEVDWGDGPSGQADTETFSFAAGADLVEREPSLRDRRLRRQLAS